MYIIAALAMAALILFAALAIDVGSIWSVRTQAQNANDAAALAAAYAMIVKGSSASPSTVNTSAAVTAGTTYAAANGTLRNGPVNVRSGDFQFGTWDVGNRTFTPFASGAPELQNTTPPGRPDLVTGVKLIVASDGTAGANKPAPVFLSQLLGRTGFNVQNEAIAYLGFAGDWNPAQFKLPIAIDNCKISTGGGGSDPNKCGTGYCQTVSSPPNPCPNEPSSGSPLKWPQGATNVTCLEFSSTGQQNACWTVFDGNSASINNPDLKGIVDSGNTNGLQAGDSAYLDNGDKDTTLKYIRDKFYFGVGGGPPAGVDRYGPNPPLPVSSAPAIDSWVVLLPVFECDPGRHCSGGGAGKIVGSTCFEIREILAPSGPYGDSSRKIKGRFLCGDSPNQQERDLFNQYCRDTGDGGSGPGGCDGGIRADKVVLVK